MTDTLHDDLSALAATVVVPPVDVAGLVRRAYEERRRARALTAALGAFAVALGGASTVALLSPDGRQSVTATTPRPTASPAVPTRQNLEQAVARTLVGARVADAEELPAAYLPPGTSAFADRNRLGRVTATVALPGGPGVSVAWDLLDRPLSDSEARRFVADRLAHDPTLPDPDVRVVHEERGDRSGLLLWRIEGATGAPVPVPVLVLAGWAANGANVVASRPTSPVAGDETQEAGELLALARDLLGERPEAASTPQAGRRVAPGINAPPPTRIAETDDFGRITDIWTTDGATWLRVERYDMLSGDAAREAAAADGQEVANDYYLRLRPEAWTRYRVADDIIVWGSIVLSRSVDPVPSDLPALTRLVDGDSGPAPVLFHVDVEDGAVVGLEEQYRP